MNTTKPEEIPYIEVTGTVIKEVIPDEIYIRIIIREKYINRTKVSIEEQEEKLKIVVKSIGIDLINLCLSEASSDYVKIRWQKKDVLTNKEYILRVSNATTVGQVFFELEKLDITEAFISKVNHTEMDILEKEVKIQAIKAAKDKADYLLTAIGEQTGKPLIIREDKFSSNQMNSHLPILDSLSNNSTYNEGGAKKKTDENNEIQFKKINIHTSIYVKFSIK
jgi:hypothetical protein